MIHNNKKIFNKDEKTVAVGHIPSGLFIVCAKDNNRKEGFMASWIQQVSFNPLLISLAVKKDRPAHDMIKQGKIFTINILGEHDTSISEHFCNPLAPENNPFEKLETKYSGNGGIIFSAAKSVLECRLHSYTEPGDHTLFVAEVLNSYVLNEKSRPEVHIRKSGGGY